uniref:Integrase catalytic domain-containing protein n=1 Tax=Amphimedon queenslandica TaxID=400682 RepID=A0A1X7V1E5_AMPQE
MAQVVKFIRILQKGPQDEMVLSRDMKLAHTALMRIAQLSNIMNKRFNSWQETKHHRSSHCYVRVEHGGVNSTLTVRYQGRSYPFPTLPPLPPLRVEEKPPFWFTGIDFAEPMFTRDSVFREKKELETVTFLSCFKRFTARTGFPSKTLSDNSKTFKAANKWLSTILEHPKLKKFMIGNGIRWQFNVEKAPWRLPTLPEKPEKEEDSYVPGLRDGATQLTK